MAIVLSVNGREHAVDVDAQMPLLWVLRDVLGLTGTKLGCGVSQCGACTVLIEGESVRSCVFPVGALGGRRVSTVEGAGQVLEALQQAWVEHQVSQCGYCQSGMLMSAVALLKKNTRPTHDDMARELTNICRCGTYPRVERAILSAAARLNTK